MDSKIKNTIILFLRYYYYRTRCFYEILFPNSGVNIKNSENVVATPFTLLFMNIVLLIIFIMHKYNFEIRIIENQQSNYSIIVFGILFLYGIYIFLNIKFFQKNIIDNYNEYKNNYINEEPVKRRKNGWLLVVYQITHILITGLQLVLFVKYW